jgi:hypothetical protein
VTGRQPDPNSRRPVLSGAPLVELLVHTQHGWMKHRYRRAMTTIFWSYGQPTLICVELAAPSTESICAAASA